MPNVAEIYDKGPGDHTLILNTRCQLVYPFEAPNWQDLRVGFLLSVTDDTNDDLITGLGPETLWNSGNNLPQDQVWIGIKTNNDALPLSNNVGFIGYSPCFGNPIFGAELVSSDAAIGTTTTNFWRPRASGPLGTHDDFPSAIITDGTSLAIPGAFLHVQPHFPQFTDGTHGYATLLMLRIQKTGTPHSPTFTVSIKQGTESGDVLFTNTPTLDLLESNLGSYPSVVQTKIANQLTHVPDALYLYWPFHNSRLRCHALGFMKFR